MCFSQNGSLAVALTGFLVAFVIMKKNFYAAIGIAYFSLMEVIQYFQYSVIDECDSKVNQFLTKLGYLHICFQPLFFNIWLFAFTDNPDFRFLYLSFFGGILMASRIFYTKDGATCDPNNEPLCGKKTCAMSGKRHIAWQVKLRAAGKNWFTPSIGLHFFLWSIPVLTMLQIKPVVALILTGPWLGFALTDDIHESPAIWCYTAIAQMILSVALLS